MKNIKYKFDFELNAKALSIINLKLKDTKIFNNVYKIETTIITIKTFLFLYTKSKIVLLK